MAWPRLPIASDPQDKRGSSQHILTRLTININSNSSSFHPAFAITKVKKQRFVAEWKVGVHTPLLI